MKWRQSLDRLDEPDNHSNCRLNFERGTSLEVVATMMDHNQPFMQST